MLARSTGSMVTFSNPFTTGDCQRDVPYGSYVSLVEEELLQDLSIEAHRWTASDLMVRNTGSHAGKTTMHMTTREDLDRAIASDRILSETTQKSEAALSTVKDLT